MGEEGGGACLQALPQGAQGQLGLVLGGGGDSIQRDQTLSRSYWLKGSELLVVGWGGLLISQSPPELAIINQLVTSYYVATAYVHASAIGLYHSEVAGSDQLPG